MLMAQALILHLCEICQYPVPADIFTFLADHPTHSDIRDEWPNDRWWIWKYDAENAPGFNRVVQGDKGLSKAQTRLSVEN